MSASLATQGGGLVEGFAVEDIHALLRQASRRSSSINDQTRNRMNRISKPSSTGNSPRNPTARRSTLAAGYGQQFNLARQAHPSLETTEYMTDGDSGSKVRPTSWHPPSIQPKPVSLAPAAPTDYFPQTSMSTYTFPTGAFVTTQVNGLITPLSQPCCGDPLNSETFSGLDEDPYAYLDEFRGPSEPEWPSYTYSWDSACHSHRESHMHMSPGAESSEPFKSKMNTTLPSPESLPTQGTSTVDSSDPILTKIESTTEDLVGMGLYDPPSDYATTVFSGSLLGEGRSGKGLKLEETFEPSAVDEDEDEDEEEDAPGEEDILVEEDAKVSSHETRTTSSLPNETRVGNSFVPHQGPNMISSNPSITGWI